MTSDLWDRVVSAALVGTERRPLAPATAADVAALVEAPVTRASEELSLLTAAAALSSFRRTGVTATPSDRPRPVPAPADDRPEVSPAAGQLLELLLDGHVRVRGGPRHLLAEWLRRCAATGRRPSPRALPALLDQATAAPALRAAVLAAGGPRLRWLAGHNPAWSWAATATATASTTATATNASPGMAAGTGTDRPELGDGNGERATTTGKPVPDASDGELARGSGDPGGSGDGGGGGSYGGEVWRTGAPAERLAYLVACRATDPGAARALVQETWSGEKASDRARILEVLRDGLGPSDEDFLEAALDDRAAAVRAAAAELLASLPSSRLARRMRDRLRPLVRTASRPPAGRSGRRLTIELPGEPDAAARRDGIDDRDPSKMGRRTWWLFQVVAATPLPFWTDELGISPAEAVARVPVPELVDAWVQAAARQRDPEWAGALLQVRPDPRLLDALPAAAVPPVVEVLLDSCSEAQVATLLGGVPGPWPHRLTERVVERLRATGGKRTVALEPALERLAAAGDPGVVPRLERWMAEAAADPKLRRLPAVLRDVVHTLSIRQAIVQELP